MKNVKFLDWNEFEELLQINCHSSVKNTHFYDYILSELGGNMSYLLKKSLFIHTQLLSIQIFS